MRVISSIEEMQDEARLIKAAGKRIGLVPTMGALHEGHLSLLDVAKKECDVLIATIFVNPTQFGPQEDFSNYPRTMESDLSACEERGVDIVFTPSKTEIYPPDYSTYVNEELISKDMCGISRPVHFQGVTTIVNILFNITQPDCAVFGQKDAQQAALIKKMVRDLCIPVRVIIGPTVRESSGLAMSSRNRYLKPEQFEEAGKLYSALKTGKELVEAGNTSVERIRAEVTHHLSGSRRIRVIYISIIDTESMQPVKEIIPGKTLIAAAIWLEQIRLIDNIIL